MDWLDKGLPPNEEGRETVHEDYGATNRRVPQIVELVGVQVMLHKKEILIPIVKIRLLKQFLQVLVVMMVTMGGGNRWGGGTSDGIGGDGSSGGGYVSQVDPSMSWAQGSENYYATQDTDHGY